MTNIIVKHGSLSQDQKIKLYIPQLLVAILGGMMISISCTAYLSVSSNVIGAFIFPIGLLSILSLNFNLYTGKVGYLIEFGTTYIPEVLVTLVGNFIGALICSQLILLTRFQNILVTKASTIVTNKSSDTWFSVFILSLFCGILMFVAVDNFKKKRDIVSVIVVILAVSTFILCGFNHSIADMFYVFLTQMTCQKLVYLFITVIGNACGGILIPVVFMIKNHLTADA